MSRLLAAVAFGAIALAPVAAQATSQVPLTGQCDGIVDTMCREGECPELDCGLVPPCLVWTFATACVI